MSKIDLLFITIDRKYGDDVENGNPARALVLHEFMEALLRIAAIRHEHEPAARGLSLPAALEQLLHRHILHYCGALGSAQNVRFTLEGPKVRRHIVRHDAELRRTLGRAAAATPGQLSIDEWLSLMGATELKLRDGAVRTFRKGELIEAFQAAQLLATTTRRRPPPPTRSASSCTLSLSRL